MHFIVTTKGTIRFLDKKGQLMHDRMWCCILVGIPEHGKVFCIFMIGIARKDLICLVGRMHIKDEEPVLIESIIDFFKDIPYFHLILHVADRIRIAGHKVVFTSLGQVQHIAFHKINLLLG